MTADRNWNPEYAIRREPNQWGVIGHCAQCHWGIFAHEPIVETPVADGIEIRHRNPRPLLRCTGA